MISIFYEYKMSYVQIMKDRILCSVTNFGHMKVYVYNVLRSLEIHQFQKDQAVQDHYIWKGLMNFIKLNN